MKFVFTYWDGNYESTVDLYVIEANDKAHLLHKVVTDKTIIDELFSPYVEDNYWKIDNLSGSYKKIPADKNPYQVLAEWYGTEHAISSEKLISDLHSCDGIITITGNLLDDIINNREYDLDFSGKISDINECYQIDLLNENELYTREFDHEAIRNHFRTTPVGANGVTAIKRLVCF